MGDDVIITGTRATGITAAESAAPIKLLGAETISPIGQSSLDQFLTQLVPSFTAQAFGGDTANLTLSARPGAARPEIEPTVPPMASRRRTSSSSPSSSRAT